MNFKHLKTFYTLSEEKSFTKTAVRLGCAQSGVTAQIRLFEESLGVRLFERIGKQVSLTAEGEQLMPYARKILSLVSEASALFQDFQRVTVGVSESIANYLFGDILKEFSAVYPDAEIYLKILDGRDYCQMLCDGEIDLAVVLDAAVAGRQLLVLKKRKENIVLTAASTHELSGKSSISPQDFTDYGMLLPPRDCPYRQFFEQKLHSMGVRPKAALETDSVAIIKESSLSGVGLGLLPEFAVKKELVYHMLERIPYQPDVPVYTQILMHPDKWLSPCLKNFIEVVTRHLN